MAGERKQQILETLAKMLESPKREKITTASLAAAPCRTSGPFDKWLEQFKQAIDRDPVYAAAYAGQPFFLSAWRALRRRPLTRHADEDELGDSAERLHQPDVDGDEPPRAVLAARRRPVADREPHQGADPRGHPAALLAP